MSATAPRRAPAAATLAMLAAPMVAAAVLGAIAIHDDAVASPSTTTVAPTTTVSATSTTRPATTSTGAPTTTEAGPQPRSSRRVAAAVDIEKIRPTSLPLRTLAITTGVLIAALAVAGFVYGKLRSRIPAAPKVKPAAASEGPRSPVDATPLGSPPLVAPAATALPPPQVQPLPPPDAVNEWAPPKR